MKILKAYPIFYIYLFAVSIMMLLFSSDAISQDETYHHFADTRTLWGIKNFWNVVSNVPFLGLGIYALYKLLKLKDLRIDEEIKIAYILLFTGITLLSLGSAYYHLDPNTHTLLWDRLPMTIAFMALFSIVISEFISIKEAKRLLYPLLFLGIFSVLYWAYTEKQGYGDLRLYFFVQFFPMLTIPLILLFFKSSYTLSRGYVYLLLSYVLAKIFEYFDTQIYEYLVFISGHSLKHIVAALGLYILLFTYSKRRKHALISSANKRAKQ